MIKVQYCKFRQVLLGRIQNSSGVTCHCHTWRNMGSAKICRSLRKAFSNGWTQLGEWISFFSALRPIYHFYLPFPHRISSSWTFLHCICKESSTELTLMLLYPQTPATSWGSWKWSKAGSVILPFQHLQTFPKNSLSYCQNTSWQLIEICLFLTGIKHYWNPENGQRQKNGHCFLWFAEKVLSR